MLRMSIPGLMDHDQSSLDVPTHWPGVIWLEQQRCVWDRFPSESSLSPNRRKKYSPDSKPVLPHGRRLVRLFHIPGLACSNGRFRALCRPLLPPFALNAPLADAPVPVAPACACAPGCIPPSSARTSGPRAQGLALMPPTVLAQPKPCSMSFLFCCDTA